MRRHLDDHPNLNNSGIFSNSTLPLTVSQRTTGSPRSFSELDARTGVGHNIPPTTVNTTTITTTSTSLSFHHSGGRAPASPRAGGAASNNKPLISRQPLALIQETVHAVGASGNTEMQSGVQFSLPSGYQARVAAATTLSQGNLGLNQPSTVHHSLPLQAQAHSNTQIVHSLQSSQAHVAAQMQGHQMQFQRLKVEDALSYLDQVKYKFGNQPQVYNDFLDIMKEFKSESIDTPGVIQRVSNLFRGHPELIVGFNTFLPPGYRIEVQPNEQVQVSIPGTSMGAGGVSTGPTSLTIHPTGPPSTVQPIHPTHSTQTNHMSHSSSPHSSPGNSVNKTSSHSTPVVNNQPHSNSQNQHIFNQSSPAHSQPSSGSPAMNQSSNNTAPQQTSQPVDFNHAINYVNKIKIAFDDAWCCFDQNFSKVNDELKILKYKKEKILREERRIRTDQRRNTEIIRNQDVEEEAEESHSSGDSMQLICAGCMRNFESENSFMLHVCTKQDMSEDEELEEYEEEEDEEPFSFDELIPVVCAGCRRNFESENSFMLHVCTEQYITDTQDEVVEAVGQSMFRQGHRNIVQASLTVNTHQALNASQNMTGFTNSLFLPSRCFFDD